MNAPLRRRHHALMLALAVALPTGLIAAVTQRAPRPIASELPRDPRAFGAVAALPEGVGVARELENESGQRWRVRLEVARVAVAQTRGEPLPDLLAYWSPSAVADELPADAVLLGAVAASERTFLVPRDRGVLVLFSLAHGEIAAECELEAR